MGMEFKEVCTTWSHFQKAEETVGNVCLIEWWSTKSYHEKEDSQRKNIRCGSLTW